MGDWSKFQRADGIRQWSYRGRPLYTYVKDTFPGARLGDGLRRTWHLMFEPVKLPAGMKIGSTLLGLVLADHSGRTLYTRAETEDAAGMHSSDAGRWQPFLAPSPCR